MPERRCENVKDVEFLKRNKKDLIILILESTSFTFLQRLSDVFQTAFRHLALCDNSLSSHSLLAALGEAAEAAAAAPAGASPLAAFVPLAAPGTVAGIPQTLARAFAAPPSPPSSWLCRQAFQEHHAGGTRVAPASRRASHTAGQVLGRVSLNLQRQHELQLCLCLCTLLTDMFWKVRQEASQ